MFRELIAGGGGARQPVGDAARFRGVQERGLQVAQGAETIDLEWYRDQRSGKPVRNGITSSEFPSVQAQVGWMSFAMPAAFFVLWPNWVFFPQFAADESWDDDSGI